MSERTATQRFVVLNVLADYTGQFLTHALITRIHHRLTAEIETGPCAWAFHPEATTQDEGADSASPRD